jgi:hypothetical protein
VGPPGASIPTTLTLGLLDGVSVRGPVGRRKDRLAPWASLDAGVLARAADVPYSGGHQPHR